nr:hypothetical protein [Tanacetum cinerariifolium]
MSWFLTCSRCGVPFNGGNYRYCTNVSFGDEPVYDSNPNSYNQTPNFSYPPSQLQTSSSNQFHCFRCGNPLEDGVRFKGVLASGVDLVLEKEFACFALQESTIHLNEIISQDPSFITITPILLNMEPEDFLIMGDEDLSTIPEKGIGR